MSATSGGGRGRGRGTSKETDPDRPVGMGRGKSRQITTPPSPASSLPSSTVPPEVEEQVRAQRQEAEELVRKLKEIDSSIGQEGDKSIDKPNNASFPTPQFSNLNPNCAEFIPRSQQQPLKQDPMTLNSQLNVDAPEFVPSTVAAAAAPALPPMEMFEPQIAALGVTVAEMVAPFISLVPDEELYLLDSAAELLLKCAASPELFDTEMDCLLSTIKLKNPKPSTLSNMAKLIVIWGEKDTTLQYVASKFCAYCFLPLYNNGFTETFVVTVREKNYELFQQATDPYDVIRFSTFLAELFFRVRTEEGNPLWPFGEFLGKFILKLLTLPFDQSVMSIVNMLKLTGSILDSSDTHKNTLDTITVQLSALIQGNVHNLSSHVCTAVQHLLELRGNQWSPPTPKITVPTMYTTEDDTVYFVPTGNANIPAFKEEQPPSFQPQQQLPVVNPADWSEYIIEDDAANTADNGSYDADFLEEDDFEAAFEDFLQETQTHYRMFPSYHP